jgi:hypothetical protein
VVRGPGRQGSQDDADRLHQEEVEESLRFKLANFGPLPVAPAAGLFVFYFSSFSNSFLGNGTPSFRDRRSAPPLRARNIPAEIDGVSPPKRKSGTISGPAPKADERKLMYYVVAFEL